jgi:KipI family sensor histidine kinase inhibitor
MRLRPAGACGVLAEVDDLDTVHRLAAAVRTAALPGVVDVVPGYRTVLVTVAEPAQLAAVRDVVPVLELGSPAATTAAALDVPVVYDGEDLGDVCRLTGLSADEVVARHTAVEYVVAFLGFTPGFPYLVGLDPALHVPRRATPRTAVPAGAVGLAGAQTGVYPSPSPGGWQLIGRTDVVLFDVARDPAALLAAGDRLRFVAGT